MKVAVGVGLAGLIGSLVAVSVSMYSGWTDGVLTQLLAGLVIGGVPGVVLGWAMGNLAGNLSSSEQKVPMSPAWGVCTGFTYGVFLGPALCAICGFVIGHIYMLMGWGDLGLPLLTSGLVVGAFIGPVVSVVAWEASYFVGLGDLAGFTSGDESS
jgi:hypothetical protein